MSVSFVLWMFFSPIAALMAYLITYAEYRRHFPDPGRAMREAWRTAILTLLVFLALGAAVSIALPRVLK